MLLSESFFSDSGVNIGGIVLHPRKGMASKPRSINEWIKRYLREEEPRSKSLIVTIFGDSLAPSVTAVWLGELIELLQPFEVNERLVRTSAFRLVEEGWLESTRDGRRSRYALPPSGTRRFEHAYRRIYTPPPENWNRKWTLVILPKTGNGPAERSELRRELEWEGFGTLAPGVLVHPSADPKTLGDILDQLELRQRAMVLAASDLPALGTRPVTALAQECWNLDDVARGYRGFLARFEPVAALASDGLTPENAFVVQTLLMHSFRRVSLHDPRLPAELVGPDWPGHAAYELCRNLYRMTVKDTHRFLRSKLPGTVGRNVPESLLQRFGGLGT